MSKNTYWIVDGEGTKALVEGADQRDYWTKVRGWSESSEPTGYEFVWLRNDGLDSAPVRMNWTASQDAVWTDLGFRPGMPPEPENLAIPAEHPSRAVPPAPAAAESAPKSSPAKATATSGDNKE